VNKIFCERFYEVQGQILGSLLDAVSTALRRISQVRLTCKPRMADFANWVVAAEPALPWKEGAFLQSYIENRGKADQVALESSPIGLPLLALLDLEPRWDGTFKELLATLEDRFVDEKTKKAKDWPKTPRSLSAKLDRLAPNLRRRKVTITKHAHEKRGTTITIEYQWKTSSPSSPGNPTPDESGDDVPRSRQTSSPRSSPCEPVFSQAGDDGDGGDGLFRPFSDESEEAEWTG